MRCYSANLLLCVLLMSSCARTPPHQVDVVQSVVGLCGMAVGQIEFERVGVDFLAIRHVDERANDKQFECVLRGLEARGMKVGFIGRAYNNP